MLKSIVCVITSIAICTAPLTVSAQQSSRLATDSELKQELQNYMLQSVNANVFALGSDTIGIRIEMDDSVILMIPEEEENAVKLFEFFDDERLPRQAIVDARGANADGPAQAIAEISHQLKNRDLWTEVSAEITTRIEYAEPVHDAGKLVPTAQDNSKLLETARVTKRLVGLDELLFISEASANPCDDCNSLAVGAAGGTIGAAVTCLAIASATGAAAVVTLIACLVGLGVAPSAAEATADCVQALPPHCKHKLQN